MSRDVHKYIYNKITILSYKIYCVVMMYSVSVDRADGEASPSGTSVSAYMTARCHNPKYHSVKSSS
jgi:hypothetical protein